MKSFTNLSDNSKNGICYCLASLGFDDEDVLNEANSDILIDFNVDYDRKEMSEYYKEFLKTK